MRRLLLALLALALPAAAEDYQCGADAGCPARINENGEIQEITFRKGDLISTDAGWMVSPDDGWVKIQNHLRMPCWQNVYLGAGVSATFGLGCGVPRTARGWARPTTISLVGVP